MVSLALFYVAIYTRLMRAAMLEVLPMDHVRTARSKGLGRWRIVWHHAARNALGASNPLDLAGGLIPMRNWYAPSLTDAQQAGLMDWPEADIVSLLQTGVSPRGSVHVTRAERGWWASRRRAAQPLAPHRSSRRRTST